MPLSDREKDEADDLVVSLTFGSKKERASARAAIDKWVGKHDERRQYIAEYEAANRLVDSHLNGLRAQYTRHVEPRSHIGAVAVKARVGVASGSFLATCALATLAWVVNPVLSTQDLSSGVGEQVATDLADGSHVLLNTDTVFRFQNRLRSREVTLRRGEAMFMVTHSNLRPFHVFSGAAEIRDVGTRFSARRLKDGVAVAVVEGTVEVFPSVGAEAVSLSAGEAAITSGSNVVEQPRGDEFDAMIAWKDKRLQFERTPLADVIRELQRYRQQPITLAKADIGQLRLTGGFSSSDPDLLLRTLPAVLPVHVEFHADGTAVITPRAKKVHEATSSGIAYP